MECRLVASHIVLTKKDLGDYYKVYNDSSQIYFAYVVEKGSLFIAPIKNTWFTKVYPKAKAVLLKQRNVEGDLAFSIRGVLIDQNLDLVDGVLQGELLEGKLIRIYLAQTK